MQCLSILSIVLSLTIALPSRAEAFVYYWELDETPHGVESATLVEPVEVVLSDSQTVAIASHSAALKLKEKYSVHLDQAWTASQAYRLLQAFESIPQRTNESRFPEDDRPRSIWFLSDEPIEDDIQVQPQGEGFQVFVARQALAHADPQAAQIDGVRGRFFSKRLHHAILRFVTQEGQDREALERIFTQRFGVSTYVEDYARLTENTTQEDAIRFTQFKNEELLFIANMLEEFPSGMHITPGLNFLVRRLDGLPHPFYPSAPAVAWTKSGYIEFMESAFKDQGADYIKRLVIHEKAHFLWGHLFDAQLIQDWIELGGWYENPDDQDGWSTHKQTEFVSAYAHGVNPNEDMAESISFYIVNPDKLRSRSPDKYQFIQDRVMHGDRYISRIREDLTFQVYNLWPDLVYPGRIIKTYIKVTGAPQEDKQITVEIGLHQTGDLDGAQASQIRIYASNGNDFDLWLYPIHCDKGVESSHTLKGSYTMSKYAPKGYWAPDQITLRDAQGNERQTGQVDFGWKLYIDNPLEDVDPPQYVKDSMHLSLSDGEEDGRAYQVLTAQWAFIEKSEILHVLARVNDDRNYSYSNDAYGTFDMETGKAVVDLAIPDYLSSGTYRINHMWMVDVARNWTPVKFPTEEGEPAASIEIVTTNADMVAPEVDLKRIHIEAQPTHPEAPNGETEITISFYVKDNNSGFAMAYLELRDPNGVYHHSRIYDEDFWRVYRSADRPSPDQYAQYVKHILLPPGSIPGTWGLAEMTVHDKAHNRRWEDFTEILHFEVDETAAAGKIVASFQLHQNTPNPFNSQTVIPYFLVNPGKVRLELFAINGQRVAVLVQEQRTAGNHSLHWDGTSQDGRSLASGVYLYRLLTEDGAIAKKLTLVR